MGSKYKAVFKDGKLLAEYSDGVLTYLAPEYFAPNRSTLPAPMVMKDIGAYTSPLDGTRITTRSQHRDHMRRHNVIEVGNDAIGTVKPPEPPRVDRELGHAIKRRIEEVKELPQAEYDAHVHVQQAQHAEIASLITPAS